MNSFVSSEWSSDSCGCGRKPDFPQHGSGVPNDSFASSEPISESCGCGQNHDFTQHVPATHNNSFVSSDWSTDSCGCKQKPYSSHDDRNLPLHGASSIISSNSNRNLGDTLQNLRHKLHGGSGKSGGGIEAQIWPWNWHGYQLPIILCHFKNGTVSYCERLDPCTGGYTDLQTDPNNCGACGVVLPPDWICCGGLPYPPGWTCSGGVPVA